MGELERLVNGSEIFQARTQGVGYLDPQQALAYGMSGPMARASGIGWDLRVNRPIGVKIRRGRTGRREGRKRAETSCIPVRRERKTRCLSETHREGMYDHFTTHGQGLTKSV